MSYVITLRLKGSSKKSPIFEKKSRRVKRLERGGWMNVQLGQGTSGQGAQ